MKWAKNALSSSFYINSPPPCEGNPSPNPLHFSICLFFAFKFHTYCVSMVYGDLPFILPSRCLHTRKLVIQSEAKDLGNTNLSTP